MRKKFCLIGFLIFNSFSFGGESFAQLADSPWPMRGQNPQHTGRGNNVNSPSNILEWKFKTEDSVRSSPAIGANGTIYFGCNDNYFYAINNDGVLQWKYQAGGNISSSPALNVDGTIYFGSSDGLYALNSNGTLKWKYKTDWGIISSPVIGSDGTIYVGSYDRFFYAINPNGTLKWKYEIGEYYSSSPAIGVDGTIYVGSYDYLYSFNPDGALKWKISGHYSSSPAIGEDGTIFIGSSDKCLYAINPEGTLKWKYQTGDTVSSPSIGLEGTIYVGSYDGNLYAVNPDGTLKWQYRIGGPVFPAPVIGSDGTIYLGYGDISAFNPDGILKWRYGTGYMTEAICIDRNGTLYVGSLEGYLYAVGNETPNEITISSPNGGEIFYAFTQADITWKRTKASNVKIEYSIDNGNSWNAIIDNYNASECLYKWILPDVNSFSCLIRISDSSNSIISDISDENFSISNSSSEITVIYPNGGETLYSGTTEEIKWVSSGFSDVKIEYSTDNCKTWNTVVQGITSAFGTYAWIVSDGCSNNCKIRISDASNPSLSDISDSIFTIENAPTLADSPWPMHRQNLLHTGRGTSIYSSSDSLKWKYELDGTGARSTPAIGKDGTIYVGSTGKYLYAFNPDGTLKWKFETNSGIFSSPALASDGTIYFGCTDTYIYAVKSDGTLKWKYQLGNLTYSSPVIGTDGTVYIGSRDFGLYAIEANGRLKWNCSIGDIFSSPAVGKDGTIYVGSDNNYIYAVNPDGTLKWKFQTLYNNQSSPAIGTDGTIYFGSVDAHLYAVNFDGTLKWSYKTGVIRFSSPALGKDGTVYIGTNSDPVGNYLYAINADGTLKWKYFADSSIESSPAIGTDGTVYVGAGSNIIAIDDDGNLKWQYFLGSFVRSSPALGADGSLYIGNDYLYAFAPEKPSSVENENPSSYKVYEPYPNPFNPVTTISYSIPKSGHISLNVYSISGQKVATLIDGFVESGKHEVTFNGSGLASGVYLYRFEAQGFSKTGRILLMK